MTMGDLEVLPAKEIEDCQEALYFIRHTLQDFHIETLQRQPWTSSAPVLDSDGRLQALES